MEYRIGDCVLDSRKFELRKDGRRVAAEPQVLTLLFVLIDNRDRLVSKDELVSTIWDGRAVSDSAISSRIKSARKLLGDDGDAQRLIRTVHGKGFRFVGDVAVDAPSPADTQAQKPSGKGRTGAARLLLPLVAGGVLVLGGVLLTRGWQSAPVTVSVGPATASPDSLMLARDLNAKLAMLSGVNAGAMRLLERSKRQKPDLRFDVDASADGDQVTSNLVLLDDRDEVLWSAGFRQSRARIADLKQQLGFTAGKVLDCTLDAIAKDKPRLDRQVVKLYLNGCAAYSDINENNIFDIERTFRTVVAQAPRFQPGWRRLLLTEAATLDDYFDPSDADLKRAEQVLAAASKVNPALPEMQILHGETARPTAMTDRMRFVETAVREAPADSDIAMIHSLYLLKVGRLKEAVGEAMRSVRNDPLSPVNREAAVIALATAGRIPEAEQQLHEAELLWPGASTIREARFTVYLRFANPREAIRLRDSGLPLPSLSPFVGSFLTARAEPTPANVEMALRDARALYARTPLAIASLSQELGEFHREDELFPILLNWQHPDKVDQITDVLFRPALSNFRHDPRFMRVAARLGLLQYWKSSGNWPDFCFDSDLPYDCRREAAKIA